MTDPMELFWASLESEQPLFTETDLRRWPEGYGQRLSEMGLLRLAETATHVVCPGCDGGHVEPVIPQAGPGGVRFYVRCPEALRVEVPADHLRQWTVDLTALVKALASALRPGSHSREVVPGRLWVLGKTQWQGVSREVLLARGLTWADAETVARRVGTGGRPIVLVADQIPPANLWTGRVPAVVLLSRVASLGATDVEMDATHMMMLVKDADAAAERASLLPIAPKDRVKVINQHVRAAMKKQLDQDAYVAAYKLHGTAREAAAALEKEGIKVHFSTIARAVERAKTSKEIARTTDSQSVRRTVASHRRDSGRKILQRTQHPDSE